MNRSLPLIFLALVNTGLAAEPFALKDGDRVVMIGGAFIEREAESGYIETLLTIQNPDKAITFRNLGWSGDTVSGIARARFGTPEDGFQHLKSHVLGLKPTVILVCYGMTESFEGETGLPGFEKGLDRLLDMLAETKARIVLISPIRHEAKPPPLPDPKGHNESLERYAKALSNAASRHGYPFVDLLHATFLGDAGSLTTDGLQPSPKGYWDVAVEILTQLSPAIPSPEWGLDIDPSWAIGPFRPWKEREAKLLMPAIARAEPLANGLRFEAKAPFLPAFDLSPGTPVPTPCSLRLPPGRYTLKVDGRPAALREVPGKPGEFLFLNPDEGRVEPLRSAIVAKNRLYFHRWRPQNETYLFGFRKHEQGQNAREIPLFDPLVDEKEKEIARLKAPAAHAFEVVREG